MGYPRLRDMTEPELGVLMRSAADEVAMSLPPGTLFILIAFDPPDPIEPDGGVAQYISNCRREGIVATLRETADRLASRETIERVPFDGPTYTCPACGMVSHDRDDVRLGYCGACHRFHGTDEVRP